MHIGTEKIGSTAIQTALETNRERLAGHGVAVFGTSEQPLARDLVAFFRERPDDYWVQRRWGSVDQKNKKQSESLSDLEASSRSAQSRATLGVLSSEHFHSRLGDPHEVAALADFLRYHFDSVAVLCFLRPQDELRASHYSTYVINGKKEKLGFFSPAAGIDLDYFDYRRLLTRWADAFGRENMRVLPYWGSGKTKYDVREDFFSQLLPDQVLGTVDLPNNRENQSLTRRQLTAIRSMNRILRTRLRSKLGVARVQSLRALILGIPGLKKGGMISYSDPAVREFFSSSNNWVSEEFDIDPSFWGERDSANA